MDHRIDFHCHILPGADHGSTGTDVSLDQIRLQQFAGIDRIVATPHFYPEQTSIDEFLVMRNFTSEKLKNALPENAPTIYLGAEVLVCPEIDKMNGIEKLCVKGTNTILLEMPFTRFSDKILYAVENMTKRDLTVVMAHIDRYDYDDVSELMCLQVLGQVNASALVHRKTRRELEKYFMADRIVAFGTDLHGADEKSVRKYEKGLSKLGEYNERIISGYTERLLEGAKAL
ncbi:MAG: histidinol-phosphatase [Clostridia bacterium]|nr:histidinol-phosphatase [Clostridia bacterium]